jgi:hypothetical protein
MDRPARQRASGDNREDSSMIRNLKILIAAGMALAAFGAISASSVQAAEGHCSVEPCTITVKPDGITGSIGKTAHQVFIVKQGSSSIAFTCQQISGDATSAVKTFKTVTISQIAYSSCASFAEFTVKMNGCEYHFVTPGGIPHDATAQVKCPAGKVIEIQATGSPCLVTIGSTGVLGGGLKFHDAETGGVKKDLITAETTVTGIPVTVVNPCPGVGAGAGTAEYTTGNVELTGETTAGARAILWWE